MIISIGILKNSIEHYKKIHRTSENFTGSEAANAGISAGFATMLLVLAIIFFTLELLVMFYAIVRAVTCTKTSQGRIIHVVLAISFTLPYMLLSIFFGKCTFDVY
jgi:hypothetical protein